MRDSWWDDGEPWWLPRRKPGLWTLLEREFGHLDPRRREQFARVCAVHERYMLSGEKERHRALKQAIAKGGRQMLSRAWANGWRDGDLFPAMSAPEATDRWGREEHKLTWWGLAVRVTGRDEAGHGSTLALTPAGVEFYRGKLLVPKNALVRVRYVVGHPEFRAPEEFIRLEGPPTWSVHDALGPDSVFDLRDLSV